MGKGSKVKGANFERECNKLLLKHNINSRKQPGSGAFDGFDSDLQILWPNGEKELIECKRRETGFTACYDALEQDGAPYVLFRKNNKKLGVVMYGDDWISLLKYKWDALESPAPASGKEEADRLYKKLRKEEKQHKKTLFELARMGNKVKDLERRIENSGY